MSVKIMSRPLPEKQTGMEMEKKAASIMEPRKKDPDRQDLLIRLEPFNAADYAQLIAWVPDAEMAMQFAGPSLPYPITFDMLDHSMQDPKRNSFRVVLKESNISIGHGELYRLENSIKLSRLLVGDPNQRGKGIGQQLVRLLVNKAFESHDVPVAELYVFDWNIGAIKCYEKIGFVSDPKNQIERSINGKTWIAIRMTITKDRFVAQV